MIEEVCHSPTSGWGGVAAQHFKSVEGIKAVFSNAQFMEFATAHKPLFCKVPDVTQNF